MQTQLCNANADTSPRRILSGYLGGSIERESETTTIFAHTFTQSLLLFVCSSGLFRPFRIVLRTSLRSREERSRCRQTAGLISRDTSDGFAGKPTFCSSADIPIRCRLQGTPASKEKRSSQNCQGFASA